MCGDVAAAAASRIGAERVPNAVEERAEREIRTVAFASAASFCVPKSRSAREVRTAAIVVHIGACKPEIALDIMIRKSARQRRSDSTASGPGRAPWCWIERPDGSVSGSVPTSSCFR